GGIIVAAEAAEGVLRPRTLVARLRAIHAPLGIAVLLVVAGPWHALAAARNAGFLWDYTVNQHVLFFFDEKLPRDSIPDSLGFFLAMFLTRGLPWSLLLPAAGLWAYRTMRDDPVRAPAVGLIAAWVAVVLGFFALAPSRLEHYSLPALPATALLVGALLADARSRVRLGGLVGPLAAAAALTLSVMLLPPGRFIAWIEPTLTGLGLDTLARPTGLLLAGTLGGMALLLARHRTRLAMGIGVAGTAMLLVVVQVAHERTEALFSWRPFAEMIHARAPDGARVFFRASDEYQLCGGLEYYLRQPLDLLAPSGWVPPTFLAGRAERLFTSPAELARHERVRLGVVHRQAAGADVNQRRRHLEPPCVRLDDDALALHHSEPRRVRRRHHDHVAPAVAAVEVLLLVDNGVELALGAERHQAELARRGREGGE